MKTIGIIPSRYASSRLPGKPLIDILGKSMVQRVYEQCLKSEKLDKVIVATDDQRIYRHVIEFGGEVTMTSEKHQSGTDRCNEVMNQQKERYDVVVNIQGDEPFISPSQIDLLIDCFEEDKQTKIATLVKRIIHSKELTDPNKVRVVRDSNGYALYFSRQVIPFLRETKVESWVEKFVYYKHIGMYSYKTEILNELADLPPSKLEQAEMLEQLRWLENGYRIKTAITEEEAFSIDTPEDLSQLL
ncbi:MAG: 3-deoxy-manno-octulosonate cytidylyltransferase [Verrucomicrobia bacterium]|nr:3-deoxy-manno-octulosonate cytidylyltransferase [Verrucomicrobiota bacterium]